MVDGGTGGRAGCTERTAAIAGFAMALRELRQSAGNPSFREMSGHSHAISHTTLHEAAQGNRLPSWATTVEFVKACGAAPTDYRRRWDEASRQVRAASTKEPAPTAAFTTEPDPPDLDPVESPADAPTNRRPVLLGVATAVAVCIAVIAIVHADRSGSHPSGGPGDTTATRVKDTVAAGPVVAGARPRAADCPVQQRTPPSSPPMHPGDRGRFIGDITFPDCSHVQRDATFTKVWRLKNAGTVPWQGYVLHRIDLPARRDSCQTITDIPIARTAPGRFVDIHAEVTAPSAAGFCFARFRVRDASGREAFPAGRPLNFQVIVD